MAPRHVLLRHEDGSLETVTVGPEVRNLAQVKPGNEAKPRVRKAFPDTAFWAPHVHTDASGHAKVSLTFPDSLTYVVVETHRKNLRSS